MIIKNKNDVIITLLLCVCMCVCVQCVLDQSFQNQISFQQPDDSETKRSSEITEIIMNVGHTHTLYI